MEFITYPKPSLWSGSAKPGVVSLAIGAGVVLNDGRRFRVADVWMSFDHHGRFSEGAHIFLEPAEEPNTITRLAPDYFTDA